MNAIILERREIQNASLLLKTLTDSGKLARFKIPGILKSKNRNAYYLAPATLWDFTVMGNPKEIMTPKEFSLLHSPFGFDVNYNDLLSLSELLKPLVYLKPDLDAEKLYGHLIQTLRQWQCGLKELENALLNGLYVMFLEDMGLLHFSTFCIHCGAPPAKNDSYHLYSGSTCPQCLKSQAFHQNELLPNDWIGKFLKPQTTDGSFDDPQISTEYRSRILHFLKHSI